MACFAWARGRGQGAATRGGGRCRTPSHAPPGFGAMSPGTPPGAVKVARGAGAGGRRTEERKPRNLNGHPCRPIGPAARACAYRPDSEPDRVVADPCHGVGRRESLRGGAVGAWCQDRGELRLPVVAAGGSGNGRPCSSGREAGRPRGGSPAPPEVVGATGPAAYPLRAVGKASADCGRPDHRGDGAGAVGEGRPADGRCHVQASERPLPVPHAPGHGDGRAIEIASLLAVDPLSLWMSSWMNEPEGGRPCTLAPALWIAGTTGAQLPRSEAQRESLRQHGFPKVCSTYPQPPCYQGPLLSLIRNGEDSSHPPGFGRVFARPGGLAPGGEAVLDEQRGVLSGWRG